MLSRSDHRKESMEASKHGPFWILPIIPVALVFLTCLSLVVFQSLVTYVTPPTLPPPLLPSIKRKGGGNIILNSLFPTQFPNLSSLPSKFFDYFVTSRVLFNIFHLDLCPHGYSEITVVGALVLNWIDWLSAPPIHQTAVSSCIMPSTTLRHEGGSQSEWIWLYWVPGQQSCF